MNGEKCWCIMLLFQINLHRLVDRTLVILFWPRYWSVYSLVKKANRQNNCRLYIVALDHLVGLDAMCGQMLLDLLSQFAHLPASILDLSICKYILLTRINLHLNFFVKPRRGVFAEACLLAPFSQLVRIQNSAFFCKYIWKRPYTKKLTILLADFFKTEMCNYVTYYRVRVDYAIEVTIEIGRPSVCSSDFF